LEEAVEKVSIAGPSDKKSFTLIVISYKLYTFILHILVSFFSSIVFHIFRV